MTNWRQQTPWWKRTPSYSTLSGLPEGGAGEFRDTPRIFLPPDIHARLHALHAESLKRNVELTLIGGAELVKGEPVVRKLLAPQQECSAALVEVIGPPTWLKDIAGQVPVWVHTHLGSAFWSSTDEDTMHRMLPVFTDERFCLFVNIVVGSDKMHGRVVVANPMRAAWDGVPLVPWLPPVLMQEAGDWLTKELHGKTTTKTWEYPRHGRGKWNEEDWRL